MEGVMTHPLVSIIIPVYNSAQFLDATIQNALQQTWPNKEIVVVDDGSSDNSLSIAKAYESDRVKVISVPNGGAARARNIGFQHSKGAFIQYLDADDLMVENKIEIQMTRLSEESQPDRIVCGGQWLRFNGNIDYKIGGIGPGGNAEQDMATVDWLLLRPYNLMTVHAWLTPRALIEKAGLWNETMTLDDDGEFFIRVVGVAEKVIFCIGALTYYRTEARSSAVSNYSGFVKSLSNCDKIKSAYKSIETYREVLFRFKHPTVKNALGVNFLYMAFDSFLVCDEVYQNCIRQPEIPVAQRVFIYKLKKGKFGLACLLLGWKLAKRIFMRFGKLS